jgi:hypothetical protein
MFFGNLNYTGWIYFIMEYTELPTCFLNVKVELSLYLIK